MSLEDSRPGSSNIIRGGDKRVGKLVGIQGITNHGLHHDDGNETSVRVLDENRLYDAVASFLASKHFNERRGDILPHLPELLGKCDFYWSYEYRDGQQEGLEATRQLLKAVDAAYSHRDHRGPSSDDSSSEEGEEEDDPTIRAAQYLEPFAIYGAFWSRVTQVVTAVSSSLEIPYISGVSSSDELVGTPLFARTGLSSNGDARAAMLYYRNLGIRHVAVLYVNDSWGIHYHKALDKYANKWDIVLQGFPYDPHQEGSIQDGMVKIQESQFHHVFGILHNWREVLPVAYDMGVIGNPAYAWITAETKALASSSFSLERNDELEYKLAKALHGIGTLNAYFTPNLAFEAAMTEMATNRTLQEEFIAIQTDPSLFDNYTFPDYVPTGTAGPIFDAVLALGITACNASNNLPDLFTGQEFYKALKTTSFHGVTDLVKFDAKSGVRAVENDEEIRYSVEYVVLSLERSTADSIRFESNVATIIQGTNNVTNTLHPFIYNDNTTNVPLPLPPIPMENLDMNLLPLGVQIFGYAVTALVLLSSLLCLTWTALNHNVFVLKASQPYFLCQLCVGIAVMALAIPIWTIPLTSMVQTSVNIQVYGQSIAMTLLDGDDDNGNDTQGLDMACMSTLWLVTIGSSIGFSALASKTWRLRQLLQTGASLRRTKVRVMDGMWPLYVSLCINVTLLVCITLVAPLQYERVRMSHYDEFGRSLESFGTCRPSNAGMFYHLFGSLVALNLLGVACLTYITYTLRHAPVDFSDSYYLALTMASLLETVMLGGPITLLVQDDPTAFYLVGSSLIWISGMTILALLFVPKFMGRKRHHRVQSVVNALHPQKNSATNKRSGGSTAGTGSHHHRLAYAAGERPPSSSSSSSGSASATETQSSSIKGRMSVYRKPNISTIR